MQSATAHELLLDHAYAVCRGVARRKAKNFYYAFLALPLARRNGICAIYAFMRQADDLADDESLSREERRRRLDAWSNEWRAVCRGGSSSNPAFVAAHDAIHRFAIPLQLLDELIAGVTMDLGHAPADGPDTYATFEELYRYCYLVASVVGLVSIRIFGYADHRAEKLAEETGIAFQLTNILRDVPEDAAHNRVYLPAEDLAAHGLSVEAILRRQPKAPPSVAERALLVEYVRRAENYYRSADKLLPLVAPESRPALWVLVTIYHALLKRIEHANYNVFTRRAHVPVPQKLAILAVGLARIAWARAFA